jgi:hypothetical protein
LRRISFVQLKRGEEAKMAKKKWGKMGEGEAKAHTNI